MCGGTKAPPYEKTKIDCHSSGVPSRHALRYGGRIENRSSNCHALRVNNKLYINHALCGVNLHSCGIYLKKRYYLICINKNFFVKNKIGDSFEFNKNR